MYHPKHLNINFWPVVCATELSISQKAYRPMQMFVHLLECYLDEYNTGFLLNTIAYRGCLSLRICVKCPTQPPACYYCAFNYFYVCPHDGAAIMSSSILQPVSF